MKTLHLTLKKKWFDMISSGEKTEEYREIKPYWISRLGNVEALGETFIRSFDVVEFRNGYQKNAPKIRLEWKGIQKRTGKTEWGALPGEQYFVIKLGKIISKSN